MKKYRLNKNQIGFVFKNGILQKAVTKEGTHRLFCRDMQVVDRTEYMLPAGLSVAELESLKTKGYASECLINAGYAGALFIDGNFVKMLESGRHWLFAIDKRVEVKTIDTRKKTMQINGQEILTADKVDLRINFAFTYIVNDAKRAMTEYDNFNEALYLLFQLALREYVSSNTLDEILDQKAELGTKILSIIKPKENEFAAKFIDAGLKDVILPGDIKAILNTVLIAQKQAQANVITRREETASTRSLLNTAKLLDENKTLYRLKELEYLEKIYQNVSHISLSSGGDILGQLSHIIGDGEKSNSSKRK